ncbi:hypothetical protein NA57DRAFT_70587 [Rhizodiscina lignyota]|uniref:Uncharacterized protein n=1 Tax=Rhizodiscina lignyota TaxID=1504668 RepID=A0A9P4MB75_9PEZI|nr:hypothetical protein NA57DRAFT_70587 [Rhizodiscina lignyota]
MARPAITVDFLSSDTLFEREVLKLSDGETEDDLNQRVVQSAQDVGLSDLEIAHTLGPAINPFPAPTAPSSISTTAIHSPNSRGSLNTNSTAPTSSHSISSGEPRQSLHRPSHHKNISISSLFGPLKGKEFSPPSLESIPITLPEAHSPRRTKPHFLVRDIEIRLAHGKGLKKLSKVFRKDSMHEHIPWQMEPTPEASPTVSAMKPIGSGIRTGVAGQISIKEEDAPVITERRLFSSRPPSINTEAGERLGFRARSSKFLGKKMNRRSVTGPIDIANGRHAWSSLELSVEPETPLTPLTPLSSMEDESEIDGASTTLQAMLASSPFESPEPLRQEMKDAMKTRSFITVQALNRGELRRLKAFRNKQLLALATLHEVERNKMLSIYEQQKELIDAKYRQALTHLVEDRQVLAELDLLAALDDRLKKEQGKLRHMEAYCSPSSGRKITSQNLAMLEQQRQLVEQLQSDKYRQDSSNHLREKQDVDKARLPKQQELELAELNGKRSKALAQREEVEMAEVRSLNLIVRRRRDASVARSNLRFEVWRRNVEEEKGKIPGGLPYLRPEEVWDAFWMVDVPLKSALDDVLPPEEAHHSHQRKNALGAKQ